MTENMEVTTDHIFPIIWTDMSEQCTPRSDKLEFQESDVSPASSGNHST